MAKRVGADTPTAEYLEVVMLYRGVYAAAQPEIASKPSDAETKPAPPLCINSIEDLRNGFVGFSVETAKGLAIDIEVEIKAITKNDVSLIMFFSLILVFKNQLESKLCDRNKKMLRDGLWYYKWIAKYVIPR